jgi:hypothetical protein
VKTDCIWSYYVINHLKKKHVAYEKVNASFPSERERQSCINGNRFSELYYAAHIPVLVCLIANATTLLKHKSFPVSPNGMILEWDSFCRHSAESGVLFLFPVTGFKFQVLRVCFCFCDQTGCFRLPVPGFQFIVHRIWLHIGHFATLTVIELFGCSVVSSNRAGGFARLCPLWLAYANIFSGFAMLCLFSSPAAFYFINLNYLAAESGFAPLRRNPLPPCFYTLHYHCLLYHFFHLLPLVNPPLSTSSALSSFQLLVNLSTCQLFNLPQLPLTTSLASR